MWRSGRPLADGGLLNAGYAGHGVFTETALVHQARKLNVELLLSSGTHNCLVCEANGNCRLQDLAYFYKITDLRFEKKP